MRRRTMSDGYERPTTLAAAPLDLGSWAGTDYPLAALPCCLVDFTGRFPTLDEDS